MGVPPMRSSGHGRDAHATEGLAPQERTGGAPAPREDRLAFPTGPRLPFPSFGGSTIRKEPAMPKTSAYAALDPKSKLAPWNFERKDPGAKDVQIEILYCGVCHSDIHQVRDEWG